MGDDELAAAVQQLEEIAQRWRESIDRDDTGITPDQIALIVQAIVVLISIWQNWRK